MRVRRILAIGAAVVGVGVLGLTAWARSLMWFPGDVETVQVHCPADLPALPRDQSLKVLVWNVQYGASRRHHFFYDGGDAVHVPASDVMWTLDRIAEVVREHQPDLILWQELDRGSARTQHIDQHQLLLERLDYPCHLSAPYHRAGYVPHPPQDHLGQVEMHLSVFSRFRVDTATRIQLPLLDEPWWRQVFNLRRALLDVSLPIQGGGTLRAFDTHLSAFSKGDGTLDRQMEVLDRAMTAAGAEGAWLLGGDLNSLPPGDDPARLGEDGVWYADDVTPVKRLFDRHESVIAGPHYLAEPERWRTYLPYGADTPDRVLDYVFVGGGVEVGDVQVLQVTDVSDHLPLLVEVTLP